MATECLAIGYMYVVWYILEFHNLAFNFFSFLRNQYLSGVKYISFDFFKCARVNLGRKGAEPYNLLYDNVFTVEELWSGSKYINLSNSRLCVFHTFSDWEGKLKNVDKSEGIVLFSGILKNYIWCYIFSSYIEYFYE